MTHYSSVNPKRVKCYFQEFDSLSADTEGFSIWGEERFDSDYINN